MPNSHTRPMAVFGFPLAAVAVSAILGIASVSGTPGSDIHDACKPPATVDNANVCTARLLSVRANSTDGTISGTAVGGGAALTLWGPSDAYLKSQGFGDTPPDPIQQWDNTIDRVNNADPASPDWYGAGKSRAFLSRELNGQATRFPVNTIIVRFVPDDSHAGWFKLVSIQPVAQ